MPGFLIVNPRAGKGLSAEELCREAERRGITAHVLAEGEDAAEIARAAPAGPLGIAGGDGSLAPIATVSIERELPFVCVPFGTYNHFARDLGLDRDDPIGALAAFAGEERRVDVGRAAGRVFLNNVSLGMYARLVHEQERAGRLRAFGRLAVRRPVVHVQIDGEPVEARIVFVGNNVYDLHPLSLGVRKRLDEGVLHLGLAVGWLPSSWVSRRAPRLTIEAADETLEAGLDGEAVTLPGRLELSCDALALRVLVPPPQ